MATFVSRVADLRASAEMPLAFRGQRLAAPLVPSLARLGSASSDPQAFARLERRLLDEFRRRLPRRLDVRPSYWETAILGRHHGLPTRLLDWTELPIVALFFAVGPGSRVHPEEPGVVVATAGRRWFLHELDDEIGPTPWQIGEDGPFLFVPEFRDERLSSQRSVLSVWREPWRPFDDVADALWTFTVPADAHDDVRRELDGIGINEELLFPGLDAAGRYLAWRAHVGALEDDTRSAAKRSNSHGNQPEGRGTDAAATARRAP